MIEDRATVRGYKLTDGRYFLVTTQCGKVLSIRQPLFGCGIYPVPIKEWPPHEWVDVLAMMERENIQSSDDPARIT